MSIIPGPWFAAALEGLQSSIDTPFIIDRVELYKQPPMNYSLFSSVGCDMKVMAHLVCLNSHVVQRLFPAEHVYLWAWDHARLTLFRQLVGLTV